MVTNCELDLMLKKTDYYPAAAIEAFIELKKYRENDPNLKTKQGYLESTPVYANSDKVFGHSGRANGARRFYLKCDSPKKVFGVHFSGVEGDGNPIARIEFHINPQTASHRCILNRQFHYMSFGTDPSSIEVKAGDEIMVEARNCCFSFVAEEAG